jgi:membrane protein implicated in regulation of membrane protease activity
MVAGNNGGLFGLPYEISIIVLIILIGLLAVVGVILLRVRNRVKELNQENAEPEPVAAESWLARKWNWTVKNVNITIVVVVLLFLGTIVSTVMLYKNAQDLGTQVGYAPEQPIKFNHKLHAGQYGIQCQYCHTGVDKAKNASLPSISTCMNCHNYIKSGPQYGTKEIAKIENAYNNNVPVQWVRIHNLPDHVFFSHQQHVNAGKLSCENCHGRVQEMERVQQVSTLEMGWCINCHRETKVDSTNAYYKATFDFTKYHKNLTIGQLGGVECSKCHY